jgi:hypothetical protein
MNTSLYPMFVAIRPLKCSISISRGAASGNGSHKREVFSQEENNYEVSMNKYMDAEQAHEPKLVCVII